MNFYGRHKAQFVWLAIILFACAALAMFLWATSTHGIAVRTDSVAYLWSSENLIKGIGLGRLDGAGNFRPYTHWPPLYPIFLTLFRLLGLDGLEAARWIGVICIPLLVLLVGVSVARLTRHSLFYSAAVLAILITAPELWMTGLFAMSEPLFMVLSLSALLLFDRYVKDIKLRLLITSSLLMGLAFATRYVGFAVIAACGLFILIQNGWSWKRKVRDVMIMVGISFLPFVLWAARNVLVAGTSTNRTLELVPVTLAELQRSLQAMLDWVNPILFMPSWAVVRLVFVMAVVTLAGVFYYRHFPKAEGKARSQFWLLLLFFVISYSFFTYLARLLLDPYIPLAEERILFPVFTGFLLLIPYGLYVLQEKARSTGWLLPAVLAGLYLTSAWVVVRNNIELTAGNPSRVLVGAHEKGLGIERLVDDPFIPVLAPYKLDEYRFFTDNIELLYFLTSLNSYQLFSSEEDQLARVTNELDNHGVVLIFFDKDKMGPSYQSLLPELTLIHDGTVEIYVMPAR